MSVEMEMPKYICHKKIWALRIKSIRSLKWPNESPWDHEVGAMITPVEDGYAEFPVTKEYMEKHKPQVGGYYVVYKDGYKSFSPAKALDDGYSPILGKDETESILSEMLAIEVGDKGLVYDRVRFAKPLKCVVVNKAKENDGVEVRLLESNNAHYPVGSNVWVHEFQIDTSED